MATTITTTQKAVMPRVSLSLKEKKKRGGRDQIISRQEVEILVKQGQTIVIYDDCVLRLDSWLERHPGGRLAILHMVGKDATDEIVAYHPDATLKTMKAYRIGRKPMGPWINMTPPIRGGPYQQPQHRQPAVILPTSDLGGSSLHDKSSSLHHRATGASSKSGGVAPPRSSTSDSAAPAAHPESREDFIQWAIDQDIEKCLRDYPSLELDVQQDIAFKYRQLHQRVIDEGLYQCRYSQYGKELCRYTALFAGFLAFLHYGWYTTSAVFLGVFWHQIMFSAHDAGHRAITGNFVIDSAIGIFIADFCCGLSIGWWKSSHNVHHLVTNLPEHDPDIQNVPLFAISPKFFKSIISSYYEGFEFVWDAACEVLVPVQHYMYYPIMAVARFNLYVLSWLHVLSKKSSGLGGSKAWWIRPAEIVGMAFYWYTFGYCLVWCSIPTWFYRVVFVVVSHIVLMPLHCQINLSHWGMSTADCGQTEAFAQTQLRTTMDVDCPEWFDWYHGGLQFQAVHHLFPRVPRHNLRRGQALVKQFCEETKIPYSILGFVDGNKKVISHLSDVGKQVQIMVKCQNEMAEKGEMGAH